MSRSCYLSTFDLHRLSNAIRPYKRFDCFGVYLVGSVLARPDWRDVDVRMILDDDDFDRLFGDEELWSVFCYAVSGALRHDTGLPIDFQVQRQTEANEKHPGLRNALGGGREFAGLGDATPYARLAAVSAEPKEAEAPSKEEK